VTKLRGVQTLASLRGQPKGRLEGYRNGDDEEGEDQGLIYRLSEMSILQALEHAGLHRGTSLMTLADSVTLRG
jgi:hypothetical protein